MKQYLQHDAWQVIESGFHPENNRISESVFSIGNGSMGQRANFEEQYSGDTHQGHYVAGVYYPDKTRVGWWKNGYPEYFAKVINAPSWINIHSKINGQVLDLAMCRVEKFTRTLDMKRGLLHREFTATLPGGEQVHVVAQRFCSMHHGAIGAIQYQITPLNFSGKLELSLFVDADVVNLDSNYDEKFWSPVHCETNDKLGLIIAETKKTKFQVATGMSYSLAMDQEIMTIPATLVQTEWRAEHIVPVELKQGKTISIEKFGVVLSSLSYDPAQFAAEAHRILQQCKATGFAELLKQHEAVWNQKWEACDITIDGDIAAQQGIRFNIFQLSQTYTGDDERLNIGPKGFTGEKYGGSTYWDTEAYCLPFYLGTADQRVARNLLVYRYKHLTKAIENAAKLGFTNGAALYPMVTMNGEECHNEWEITFEEIHRNGAIAYAIFDYVRYTGNESYLAEYGLEVLIGIARFWAQRVNWSEDKKKYVMLGVTGPNEYENNVNNNWYTNYIAAWTLRYTITVLDRVKQINTSEFNTIMTRTLFNEEREVASWRKIIDHMYYPEDTARGIYLQQDGFLDKELLPVSSLNPAERPLNQKWSWDRILRSCFIKQADVLQGLYFFEDEFDLPVIKRNFDFYEPMTVHESSLSPCVHVILASKLGYKEKAYELYLRTSRLDLDDYNNDTEDGLHITSMAGTWMSIVKGFGGMRVEDGTLHFNPFIPEQWKSFSFRIEFRGRVIKIKVTSAGITAVLESGSPLEIVVHGRRHLLEQQENQFVVTTE